MRGLPTAPQQPAAAQHHRHRDEQQDGRHRRAQLLVAQEEVGARDQHRQRLAAFADDQAGDDVHRHRHREHEGRAGDDTRQRERCDDAEEAVQRPGAQRGRGLGQARIELAHHGVDGQHHEGQEDVGRGDDQRGLGVEHAHGRVGQADGHQRLVQQPVAAEEDGPGEGLDDDAHRQRQHHGHQDQRLHEAARPRQREGRGVGQQQRQQRGEQRHAHGAPQDAQVEGVGEELGVAGDRREAVLGAEALAQQQHQGQRVDQGQVGQGGCRQQHEAVDATRRADDATQGGPGGRALQ
jgi:hypothetical protein